MITGDNILMVKLMLRWFVHVVVGEDSMQLSQVHSQRETASTTTPTGNSNKIAAMIIAIVCDNTSNYRCQALF